MQRVLPMYSVLVRHARGKGIFVALDVNDGCGRNYNIRLERVEAVLFLVRASNHIFFFFVTAYPASLSDGIAISKSARSWCDMSPPSFLNIHLEYKLCFLAAITASSR